MSNIEVEFFGIARHRVNQPSTSISVDGPVSLVNILQQLADRFPDLVPDCIDNGRLTRICSANINGDHFVTDGEYQVRPADRLLIMSADAGG